MYRRQVDPNQRFGAYGTSGACGIPDQRSGACGVTRSLRPKKQKSLYGSICKQVTTAPVEKDMIVSDMKDEFGLFAMHSKIIAKMVDTSNTVATKNAQIESMLTNMRSAYTFNERAYYIGLLRQLNDEVQRMKERDDVETYLSKVAPILSKYKELCEKSVSIQFGENMNNETPDEHQKKLLAVEYTDIARLYIPIDIDVCMKAEGKCTDCGVKLHDEDGCKVCPQCGATKESGGSGVSVLHSNQVNIKSQDSINFKKALVRWQGKQEPSPAHYRLMDRLDEYFFSKGMPTRNLKVWESGQVNTNMMLAAIKHIDSRFYIDVNLLCNLYWGMPLVDISDDIMAQIMDDYNFITHELHDIRRGRSCINIQYMSYQLLTKNDVPCELTDFKMVSQDNLQKYDDDYGEACRRVGWLFKRIT